MQKIWKCIFVLTRKQYVEDFILKYLLLFEISVLVKRYVKIFFVNIQKQQNMLKKNYYFLRSLLLNNLRILKIKKVKFSGYFFT